MWFSVPVVLWPFHGSSWTYTFIYKYYTFMYKYYTFIYKYIFILYCTCSCFLNGPSSLIEHKVTNSGLKVAAKRNLDIPKFFSEKSRQTYFKNTFYWTISVWIQCLYSVDSRKFRQENILWSQGNFSCVCLKTHFVVWVWGVQATVGQTGQIWRPFPHCQIPKGVSVTGNQTAASSRMPWLHQGSFWSSTFLILFPDNCVKSFLLLSCLRN